MFCMWIAFPLHAFFLRYFHVSLFQILYMLLLRSWLLTAAFCSLAFAGRTQAPTWKWLRYGKLSLMYPPTWHMAKENIDGQSYVTITPDSMQNMVVQMFEIDELTLPANYTFAKYKKDLRGILTSKPDWPTKVLQTREIVFKRHKTIFAKIIRRSLPGKIYGIDDGTKIYAVILFERRYSNIPAP